MERSMKDNAVKQPGYLLCTIAKNEEEKIPTLLHDVAGQEIRPSLWVLVDDSSEDSTAELIGEYADKYPWIRLYKYSEERDPQVLMHISKVKSFAAEKALEISGEEGVAYGHLGIIDADIHIEPDFYKRMTARMEEVPDIGLLGSDIMSRDRSGIMSVEHARGDLPGSATMLCRRKCFEDIGGIPGNMYPEDAIMIARAKLSGWKTERNRDIRAVQLRASGTKEGDRTGYLLRGERVYFLRYSPVYILLRTAAIAFGGNPVFGALFLWGYLRGFLRQDKRLDDRALIAYFRKARLREVISYNLKRIKNIFGKAAP